MLKISNPLHLSMPLLPTKISRLAWPCAEASCSSAVRVARDLVSDVGEAVAARSGGLLELARSSINNAERDSRRVLVKRCRLSLEPYVPLSELKCAQQKLTVLRLKTWMQFLVDKRLFHIVSGLTRPDEPRQEAILDQFWANYKISHPQHPVFALERQGRVCLCRCAPLLYHGDEGRGRRRIPFLITSFSPILGRGSEPADKYRKKHGIRKDYCKQTTNLKGHSFTNRFLQASCHHSKRVWVLFM